MSDERLLYLSDYIDLLEGRYGSDLLDKIVAGKIDQIDNLEKDCIWSDLSTWASTLSCTCQDSELDDLVRVFCCECDRELEESIEAWRCRKSDWLYEAILDYADNEWPIIAEAIKHNRGH